MSTNEFPRMLYKAGGPEHIHGGQFLTLIVNDEAEQADALDQGWDMTTSDARARVEAKLAKEEQRKDAPADNEPPTRAELEQKAKDLGVKFDGRTPEKKLAEMIEAKLAKE